MQLRTLKRAGHVRDSLATLSLSLLAANAAGASAAAAQPGSGEGYSSDMGVLSLPYSQFDAAILSYEEAGGRVQAIEPTANLSVHGRGGEILTLGLTADSVTGATPNGAVPSDTPQDFVTPLRAAGSTATVTTASGGSTVIHLPPTPGQIASAALGRQYTVPANVLPMDRGFRDERVAGTIGWSQPLAGITEVGGSLSYSQEHDYRSISASGRIAQDFNDHNSTLSLAVNFEDDSSFPYGGVPVPLAVMDPTWKKSSDRSRTQTDIVLGLTEVMSRRWLMQANYTYGVSSGYQNDPYRIISVVDPLTGEPTASLYENRPGSRSRQSIYLDNRIDFDPVIPELSLRYYTDSWGITSETAEFSSRIKLLGSFYVEPDARWYRQSAANFFHYYLVGGQSLPADASSDTRLGKFTAVTYGAKIGVGLTRNTEIYLRAEHYQQTGDGHPADAIGQLRQQNLFAGVTATWFMVGYSWSFH